MHHIERTPTLNDRLKSLRAETAKTAQPLPGEEVSREEVLEQQVKEYKKLHRTLRKDEVFEQRIVDALSAAVEMCEVKYSPMAIPKSKRSSQKHEFVLLWSDTHAGRSSPARRRMASTSTRGK